MKYKKSKILMLLLCLTLLLPTAVSAQMRRGVQMLDSIEQLNEALQDPWRDALFGLNKTVEVHGDVVLAGPGQGAIGSYSDADKLGQGHILVKSGATLTVNVPGLQLMAGGNEPLIVIEAGGRLVLEQGKMYTINALEGVAIEMAEGGVFQVGPKFNLVPDRMILPPITPWDPDDSGQEPENPEPENPEPENPSPDQPEDDPVKPGPGPMEPEEPEKPGEPRLEFAEVVWLDASDRVYTYLTVPRLATNVRKIIVELSLDGDHWETAETYLRDDAAENSVVLRNEAESLVSWDDLRGVHTFLKFLRPWNPAEEHYLVRLHYVTDDGEFTTNLWDVDATGCENKRKFSGSRDYNELNGNIGGGGQGESDRVPPVVPDAPNFPESDDEHVKPRPEPEQPVKPRPVPVKPEKPELGETLPGTPVGSAPVKPAPVESEPPEISVPAAPEKPDQPTRPIHGESESRNPRPGRPAPAESNSASAHRSPDSQVENSTSAEVQPPQRPSAPMRKAASGHTAVDPEKADKMPEFPGGIEVSAIGPENQQDAANLEAAETVQSTHYIPGFVVAVAATVLVVGGTAALVWWKKK